MIIKVGGLEPLGPIGVYAYDIWHRLCCQRPGCGEAAAAI